MDRDVTVENLEHIPRSVYSLRIFCKPNYDNNSVVSANLSAIHQSVTRLELFATRNGDDEIGFLPKSITELVLGSVTGVTDTGLKNLSPNLQSSIIQDNDGLSDRGLLELPHDLKMLTVTPSDQITEAGLKKLVGTITVKQNVPIESDDSYE